MTTVSNEENLALLEHLIVNWEGETVEFKEAKNDFDTDRIGRYVSALCNEANLSGTDSAWLVFGVRDKTREVVGSSYRTEPGRLNGLKQQIFDDCSPNFSLRTIRVVNHPSGRVVMFEIPPAPQGMPISWKGVHWSRAGESLVPMSTEKLDAIRSQESMIDWTAQPIKDADLSDLSEEALSRAREAFKQKNSSRLEPEVIDSWKDEEFLRHLGLLTKRGLTRAAILLLGKPESAYLLNPHMAEITWRLMEEDRAYEHFSIPFVLSTTQLYQHIRNYKIRLLPPGELVQREIEKYDQSTVLEALHNCIAHQDYTQFSRIAVMEYPDRLVFVSQGSFFEGTPDEYAVEAHMPRRYRNTTLVTAMTGLNMIDHLGYGIERMNRSQARRYLPLPEYDLTNPGEVRLTIWGSVVDEAYTRVLMQRSDLPFDEVMALDRIQKGHPVARNILRRLRRKGLVEGRRPHLRVAASVAEAAGAKVDYLEKRGQSTEYCAAVVTDLITRGGPATRADIDDALAPYLPADLTAAQRKNRVDSLLRGMREEGAVKFERVDGRRLWTLA